MCPCTICGKDVEATRYLDVIEIEAKGSSKLGHIECCPTNSLLRYLEVKSQNELEFFHGTLELAKEPSQSRIKNFERKYGTYEEISQSTRLDSWLTVLAVIAELKKRNTE